MAVLVREDRPGDKRLVAYVVPADSGVVPLIDVSVLRSLVAERLPDYMVPSAFVVLEALPLTPNGKLDRKALPVPKVTAKVSGRGPRSPREEVLCSLFAEVLGVGKVGIDDSFFDLGGHSLLATRLVSRIRSVVDVEVSIRALFEAPTVAGLASHVDDAAGVVRVRLSGRVRPDLVPVSFAQRRLWFLGELEGPSATYNIPFALRLRGALNVEALRAALMDVVGRHESLRTVFRHTETSQPYQHIVELADDSRAARLLTVSEVDASGLGGVLAAEASAGFDLSVDLPLRVRLCVVGPDEFVLIAVVHHIAADGWSMAPFARDLSLAYQARSRGEAPAWPVLPVQYADYTLWQREVLGSEDDPDSVISHQLTYWTDALAGIPEQLELPTDFPRPPVASHTGGTIPIKVPADVHERLIALARESNCSLFMTVQAALAVLLQRMGAGEDIPIGTPVAGRTDDALDELIGFFVNTLVLRTDTSSDPTFRELLGRVRETDLAAFANQDVPFERLVEVLNPQRSMARHPLFQVMLAFQNNAQPTLDLPGLHVEHQTLEGAVAKFDLTLNLGEHHTPEGRPDGLTGRLDYRTDLFHPTTIETLATRLNQVLATIVTTPDLPIGQVDILTPTERDQLLVEWNDTARDVPEALLPQLFETQVMATPDAIAVVFEDQQLTYRELNERANQLARYLIGQGAGPERGVAVWMERSADLIVALLAVVKTGGFYVPLHEGYPAERLRFVVQDSDARLVLTDRLEAAAEFARQAQVIEVTAQAFTEQPTTDLHRNIHPKQVAYVMYTSGSTGTPKGVATTHHSVADLIADRCWQGGDHERLLMHAPHAFDVSNYEVWLPLLSGGQILLAPNEQIDASAVRNLIARGQVTAIHVTAGLFQVIAEEDPACFTHVRQVLTGGDVVSANAVHQVLAACPQTNVRALYGPTEITLCATQHHMTSAAPPDSTVPIGRPMDNTHVYVLDASLAPTPVGVTGELYISGTGLARGYVNQPALTAERFVADPFGGSGGRMYRTGDLVQWRTDGTLEFMGRADAQVKVRGFRIEPGEIETVLATHPSVGQAAVLAREERPGDKRLVAYVVPADSGVVPLIDVSVLRGVVAERLPDYMVPSAFVVLDSLPLTPNGKLDRQALPVPEVAAKVSGRGPRSPREEVLCSLFAEVLGVGKVGIDDSFFDLGGHSLLATRLVSRIRSVLDVEVSIRALFEAPTVAGLASHVDGAAGVVRVRLSGRVRPELVPVSFAQRRLWFLGELEGPSATYNIPLTVRLRGALNVEALRAALMDVVGRHESLRTVFPQVDGRPYQHILNEWDEDRAAGLLRVGEVDASGLGGVLVAEVSAGFDLSVDLPLRVRLCVVGPDEFVLIAVVHHIAADGWSMAPFARDLSLAYQARCRGEAPAWPVLPVQYADYTLWQREVLGSEDDPDSVISHQLTYWTDALAGVPEQLELPTDFPRPPVASHTGGTVPVSVPADVHERLITLARESSTSLFMTVQAALAVLLQRMGTGEDIPIGTPVAGRTDDALDELIGFFVNTLVLRTDTSSDPTFRELLGRVRETDLAAFANQDVPFERLVEVLNPQRSMARHPLFQVMLAFQNNAQPTLDLPGLHVEHQTLDGAVAKFDLTLNLGEHHTPEGQPDGLTGRLDYRTDLFHPTTIETLTTRLNQVLATIVTTPDLPIGQVDILTPTERDQLLVEWNDTARDVPETVLPQLFETQVMATPDAIAVVFEDQQLTYRELNARANQLARYLISQGAGPEGLVGLALPRSAELIVTLLAVLKSGAGYVP
ncbi:non-ribosomal peptide synthetase, partial [Streptomyces albipurpureus]